MIDPGALVLASSYVAPDGLSFWAWSEGGQVVTWTRGEGGEAPGPTIAFQGELAQVVARLAPRGLPSFQALVLLLGACRDGWLEAADASFAPLVSAAEVLDASDERLVPLLAQTLEALTVVGRLPPRLRSAPVSRAALAEVVLEGAPLGVEADLAPSVAAAIAGGVEPAERGDALTPRLRDLMADLEALRMSLAGLEPEGLAALVDARARTGLDDVPAPAPIDDVVDDDDAWPAQRVARLIEALRDDPELGGLARMARDLRAAVHVPRAVTQQDDLPLGGVSDIANRGPLDRLLVSELAHDELTFTVRVATGQALYLRREAPPRGPEGGRAVLLDGGVRLWGVPRVFATAVGLAVAAGAGKAPVRAYAARGGALVEVDLTTREGLLAHLEALDPAPHPGAALAEFAGVEDGERVLVTHEDALDDPELRRALGDATRDAPLLVATVTRDGRYALRRFGARGHRVLSEARLDLDALLAPPRRGAPPLATDDRLPAILALRPLPLRLPSGVTAERARQHPDLGVVALTRDGRLLWFQEPLGQRGGVELTDAVPLGAPRWLDLDQPGVARALVGPTSGELTLVASSLWRDDPPVTSKLPCVAPPLAVVKSGAALLLVFPRHVHVLGLSTGQPAPGLELPPGVSWRMGRFFSDGRQWLALTADGLRPVLEPLSGYARGALALWDRAGREGPWGLEPDGVLLSGSPVAKIERLSDAEASYTEVHGISHDGERLLLRALRGSSVVEVLLDVERGEPITLRYHPAGYRQAALEPTITRALANAPQVRTRLQGLAVDGQGALALVSRRRRVHALELGPHGHLVLRSVPPGEAVLRAWRPFAPRTGPAPTRAALSVAVWPDGSRAFLDGRGLLHLVPATGVEVTLVLAEGPLAAWTTEGELTGPAYFTGEAKGGDEVARAVLRHGARFCEAIR